MAPQPPCPSVTDCTVCPHDVDTAVLLKKEKKKKRGKEVSEWNLFYLFIYYFLPSLRGNLSH